MNIALIAIPIAISLIAMFSVDRRTEPSSRPQWYKLLPVLVVAAAAFLGANLIKTQPESNPTALFLSIGMLVGWFADLTDRGKTSVAPLGFGVALIAASMLLPKDVREAAQLGGGTGLAFGAWMSCHGSDRSTALRGAILAILVALVNSLGARVDTLESAGTVGTALGIIALLAALIAGFLGKQGSRTLLGVLVAAILLTGGGFLVLTRYVQVDMGWMLFAGGALSGLIVHCLLPDEENVEPARALIATVIWLGVATLAYGYGKAEGVSIAAVGGLAMLLAVGNVRAVQTTATIVVLSLYYLFRLRHPDSTRGIDIGQHYFLIGLSAGAIVPMLPVEWARLRSDSFKFSLAGAFWVVGLIIVPVAAAIVLGPKGQAGLLYGFGVAGVIESVRNSRSVSAVALGAGLGTIVVAAFAWLDNLLDLSRDEKVRAFLYVGGALIAVALVITFLSRRKPEVAVATVTAE